MQIEVWSLRECPRCAVAHANIHAAGHEVIERDLNALREGEIREVDVLTQLVMQNGHAPVVRIVSKNPRDFIDPDELEDWLAIAGKV